MIAFQVSVTAVLLLSTLTMVLLVLTNSGQSKYLQPTVYSALAMNIAFVAMLLSMVWM